MIIFVYYLLIYFLLLHLFVIVVALAPKGAKGGHAYIAS